MSDFITIDRDSEEWRVIATALRELELPYYSYGVPYPTKLVRTLYRIGLQPLKDITEEE